LQRKPNPRAELAGQLKKEAEAKRLMILHQYAMQANWLAWGLDKMMSRDLSWETILYQYSERLLNLSSIHSKTRFQLLITYEDGT
jgi:hypothetical protein